MTDLNNMNIDFAAFGKIVMDRMIETKAFRAELEALPHQSGYVLENPEIPGLFFKPQYSGSCGIADAEVFPKARALAMARRVRNSNGKYFVAKHFETARDELRAQSDRAVQTFIEQTLEIVAATSEAA